MLEKIELRKKLKEISLVNAEYSQMVIDRLQSVIKDKNCFSSEIKQFQLLMKMICLKNY